MGEGGLAKSSYNFYRGQKRLIYSLFCSIYGLCGGKGLVENVIWGEGLAESFRILSYRGGGDLELFEKPSYDI